MIYIYILLVEEQEMLLDHFQKMESRFGRTLLSS